uniref:Eukaryotic translation initiation factor 4E binding protein 2 n=1 Tax=Serinus canaria TaxID=9135 RepID=A0A8C9NMS6_SERCA
MSSSILSPIPGGSWGCRVTLIPRCRTGFPHSAPVLPPGTRIIYDRKFLLDRRNSPMAKTPPCHLPNIPGVTSPGEAGEEALPSMPSSARFSGWHFSQPDHAVVDKAFPHQPPLCQPGMAWPS